MIRREMTNTNSHHIVRLEGKINGVIQKALDSQSPRRMYHCVADRGSGIMAWLANQLTKQKKNDFRPKDDDLSFARMITEPCRLCCEFLETVRDAAYEGLSGKNVESFLTEVGVAFHRSVLQSCECLG